MLTCIACTSTNMYNNIEQESSLVSFKRRMPHMPGFLESSLASRQLSKKGKLIWMAPVHIPSTLLRKSWRCTGKHGPGCLAAASVHTEAQIKVRQAFFKKKIARAVASQPALAGCNEWTVTASPGLRQRTGYVFSRAKIATASEGSQVFKSCLCWPGVGGCRGDFVSLLWRLQSGRSLNVQELNLRTWNGLEWLLVFSYAGEFLLFPRHISITLAFLRYQLYWMDWMQFQPGWPQNAVWDGVDFDFGFLGKEGILHHPSSNKSHAALAMFHWCCGIWQVCFQKLTDRLNFLIFSEKGHVTSP